MYSLVVVVVVLVDIVVVQVVRIASLYYIEDSLVAVEVVADSMATEVVVLLVDTKVEVHQFVLVPVDVTA